MIRINKNGFTLIELLATIVVLAIVLVITVPTVLNSMSSVRQDALKASADSSSKYYREQLGMLEIGMRQEDFIIDAKLDDNGRIISRLERCITKEEAKILGLNTKDYSINQACTGKETLSNECNNLTNYSTVRWNSNKEAIVKLVGELNGKFTKGNKRLVAISGTQSSGDLNEFEETENPVLTGTTSGSVIRNLKMYGNSIQSGIPTPDAPIDIESVGDNVNILENKNTSGTINGVTFTKNADGSITMNGTNTGTNNIIYPINTDVGYAARDIALKAGTYTLSHRANLPSGIYVQAHYVDGGTTLYRTSTNSNGISFTISEDAIAGVYIRFDVGVTADNITIYPQLEKGSTVTSYVPYGKYKIPVVATSKNTFDEKFRIGSVSGTDTTRLYSTQILKIKAGETYTVSTNLDTNTYNYAVHTLKSAPPTGWDNIIVDSTWLTNKTYTFTTNVDCYIGIYIRKKDNSKISIDETADYWFQIEKGSSATTYEPYAESQTYNIYLNEPLRAIGSYRDYIDFDSGKVVRSVGKYVIDENTTWSEMQLGVVNSNYIYAYSTVLDKLAINNKLSILSISNKTSEHQGMWRESNYKNESQDVSFQTYGKLRLAILANRLENINKTSLSNWLKDNNIEVHYVLATQTEETIDLSSIKTLGNTTYIIVNTKIKPTLQGVY